jgi:6-phosphogluconolactonase
MHFRKKLGTLVIAALLVACPNDPEVKTNFSVGGSVTGLTGTGLVLQNNTADNLSLTTNAAFTFAKTLADGTAYSVTVLTQPGNSNQTCTPTKNTGTIATANITNVVITCTTPSSGSNVITSIGTTGGTATGNYGAEIIIPAGALPGTLEIGMARDSSNAPAFTLPDIDFAGAPYELTPHGTTFAVPVTVRIPFDPTQVPDDAIPTLYKAETAGTFAAIPTTVDGNMLVANISSFSWVLPAYAATRPRNVYAIQTVGTEFRAASYKIDSKTGTLTGPTSTALTGQEPTSLVAHPSGRFLYVTNRGATAENGIEPNSVSVYQLDAINGKISGSTNSVGNGISTGSTPRRAIVHPSGKFLYVILDREITFYGIDGSTGALNGPQVVSDSIGWSPLSIAFNPAGNLAYVSYPFISGSPYSDSIQVYSVNSTGAITGPINSIKTRRGLFAFTIEPNGKFAYVAIPFLNQIQIFAINATTGALSELGSIQSEFIPYSLAADSFGRFLYIGHATHLKSNVVAYRIDPNSGALSPVGEAITPCADAYCSQPIAMIAEPQGQFIYALHDILSSFQIDDKTGALSGAENIPSVFNPYRYVSKGTAFDFAATGTYPLWQNGCTANCTLTPPPGVWCCPYASSGGSGGGNNGTNQSPPTKHYLSVTRGAWGGLIISSPAGINVGDPTQGNKNVAEFPVGSTVQLSVTPPSTPAQAYAVTWSGSCSGTNKTTTVQMNSDKTCHVELTPR